MKKKKVQMGKPVPGKLSQKKLILEFSYLRLRVFHFFFTLYFYFYTPFPVITFVFPTSFLAKLLLKNSRLVSAEPRGFVHT